MEGKKPIEEQLPEGKKHAAEALQPLIGAESDGKAATPKQDEDMKQTNPLGETAIVNEVERTEAEGIEDGNVLRDRAFDTMELRIFDQWDTEGNASPVLSQKKDSDAGSELKNEKTEADSLNPTEEATGPVPMTVDFSEEISRFEKEEANAQTETAATPTERVPDDTGVFKSVKREIKSTPRPKKMLIAAIASSMVVAGVVGFSAFAYEQQAAVADTPKVTKPALKPNLFQLTLDDKKFELDLNTIGYNGKDESTIDQAKLRAWLDTVQKQVNVEPKNAHAKRFGDPITPGKPGRKVDVKKMETWLKNIKPLINKPQQIPMIKVNPLVTSKDIRNVNQKLIGKYGTKFDPGNVNRTTNMKLASQAINGIILMPGEKFSFNEVVGPRTAERGYKVAGVIVKGEFTEGIGGGICQVSSTLYNSVDEAGLKMVQVNHHSAEVTYVPKGRDATVSWGGPDFKFRNNLNKPVMIKIKLAGPYLTVYTYTAPGAKVSTKKVQKAPETFTQVKVEETKKTGQTPKAGN